jgi:hypothetical protein
MSAAIPSIRKIFMILLPNTLPIAKSELPFREAKTFITNSGKEVPKATTVSPITKGDRFARRPSETDPFTNQLAPSMSTANPTINKI